jgi:parallel beta-helix repeat protein
MSTALVRRVVAGTAIIAIIGVGIVAFLPRGSTEARAPAVGQEGNQQASSAGARNPSGIDAGHAFLGSARIEVRDCRGVRIRPSESIQRNIDHHPQGTTFCLTKGVHRLEEPLYAKSDQRFIGEPGAILSGARELSSFDHQGSYWTIGGQRQESSPVGTCSPSSYTGCQYAEGVFFDDTNLWQVTSLSALSPGSFFFDYGNNTIYLADDPTGHRVEASVVPEAFSSSGATGVVIQGLVIEKFANPAQTAALQLDPSWRAIKNEVRLNHGVGIESDTNSVVRGNYVHDQGQLGLSGYGSIGALVVDNEVAYNNTEGFDGNWEAGGSKWARTTDLTVRGNFVHDNDGPGLWTDGDNIGTLYENNRVVRNAGVGILHEISYDAIIRGNVVAHNAVVNAWLTGGGIVIQSSGNVEIYDNRVFMNGDGITLIQSDRGSGLYGPFVVQNVSVRHNTITMCDGWTGAGRTENTDTSIYDGSNRFEHNAYHVDARSSKRWFWQDTDIDRSAWRNYGNDTTGVFRVDHSC